MKSLTAMSIPLSIVLSILHSSAGLAAELESVRMARHTDYLRVVFDMNMAPDYRLRELTEPAQIVITFTDTQLQEGIDLAQFNAGAAPGLRACIMPSDHLRMVMDLTAAPDRVRNFILKPYLQRGHRLVVDIYPDPAMASHSILADAKGAAEIDTDCTRLQAPETLVTAAAITTSEPLGSAVNDVPTPAAADSFTPAVESIGNHAKTDTIDLPFRLSGTWEQEWAVTVDDGDSQKFEAVIEPRLELEVGEQTSITGIFRLRVDTVGELGPDSSRPDSYSAINGPVYNNANAEFSVRELYLDTEWGNTWWRLGKQQVVWGQADGIKVLDVVNPQSYREFILDDFDDSRIPLTMVNAEFPVAEELTLQLLWIPDTSYHELAEAGTPYFLTSPLVVPVAPSGLPVRVEDFNKPDDIFSDSDAGARLTSFVAGWDITLNYLYHYQDFPVLYQSLETGDEGVVGVISPEYERNHLAGATLSSVLAGNLTLRAELAYNSDTFHIADDLAQRGIEDSSEFAAVVGLDWQLSSDTLISGQYFQSQLLDYVDTIQRDRSERNASLYLRQSFMNETLQFSGLLLYSINRQDSWTQLKLKYMFSSNLELWLGADIISGDKEGLFGQFSETDRLLMGLKLGF